MFSQNALRRSALSINAFAFRGHLPSRCRLHYKASGQFDVRNRLSNFWAPAQWTRDAGAEAHSGHDLLVRAGFLRQAYSGIFHLLPLGLRVQNKIERLIDKHMQSLGAAKVSLSSLSSEDLWQRSGRLDKGRTSELLRFEDRKGAKYLLSPTHEEEITTIIANVVQSYKDLPLRLYQVSRKYRDEPRPRQGLLRGREFVMKDLYTFDATVEEAQKTYDQVRQAYVAFLQDLRLPYLTAKASSGNMGGDLSHEYHFASPFGEDTIISCDACDYSINEELYIGEAIEMTAPDTSQSTDVIAQHYISKDRKQLCTIYYSRSEGEPNIYAVKALFPDVDSAVQDELALAQWKGATDGHISFCESRNWHSANAIHAKAFPESHKQTVQVPSINGKRIALTKARQGDTCRQCNEGKLKLHQAVEIGHTFYLGQRYSVPLEAQIASKRNELVPIEMGCHGIGVSRLIGAAASLLMDNKGLNWPFAISPFEVMIIPGPKIESTDLDAVYDQLAATASGQTALDVAIDDRKHEIGYKLNDADLVGYPFIVVIGRAWNSAREVELQCRRLGVKTNVPLAELRDRIREYSKQL